MSQNNQCKNEPTLFINTVSDKKEGKENQVFFDSRIKKEEEKKKQENKKRIVMHRLNDIRAMLLYKLDISCEILSNDCNFKGIISSVDDNYIKMQMGDKLVNIPIDNIEDIKID